VSRVLYMVIEHFRWLVRWEDVVELEVIRVVTSADAAAAVAPRS